MGLFTKKTKEEKQEELEAKFKKFLEQSDKYKSNLLIHKRMTYAAIVYLYSTLEEGEIIIHYKSPECKKGFHKVITASNWKWGFDGNFMHERIAWLEHKANLESLGLEIILNKKE